MNSAATSAVFGAVRRWLAAPGRNARRLRIGIVNIAAQAGSAKHDHEAVLLHRLDKHLDAGNLHLPQLDR